MLKIIYLSGPMSGRPDFNKPAFNARAAELRALGHKVINPAEVDLGPGATWAEYIAHDLKLMELEGCTHLDQLEGWENSPGAQIELIASKRLIMRLYV